ncbi:hypothetical protein PCASD_20777 [Puccinia coronata f. sp. avenae]|uniref:Uncharacterized protein n=1 Tax=Puccinia coronata f. sp. avenae TaxID=200324 RepID=A0A2N5S8E5_9BASI|nr:hypothetical protein PCASD_20777 [Puccinia coronata f. sp. avenae]
MPRTQLTGTTSSNLLEGSRFKQITRCEVVPELAGVSAVTVKSRTNTSKTFDNLLSWSHHLNMSWLSLLYLQITFFYFIRAIPMPAESFLPSTSDVNSEVDAGLFDDLDLDWWDLYNRSLRENGMSNWAHEFDSDSLAFVDYPNIGHPFLDDFNHHSDTSTHIPGLGMDRLMGKQATSSASNQEATFHHQLDFGEPAATKALPGPTEKEVLHPASGTEKLPQGNNGYPSPFQIYIQPEHYEKHGRRNAAGAEFKYFGTTDTIYHLHRHAMHTCLETRNAEELKASQQFDATVSKKLEDLATHLALLPRAPEVSVEQASEALLRSDPHHSTITSASMPANPRSLAVRLLLEDFKSKKMSYPFVRKIRLVGYNLNIFHIWFDRKKVDQEILGTTEGVHEELLDWLAHLIFTHPEDQDLPQINQAHKKPKLSDPTHFCDTTAQKVLSRFLTDPTPRMGRFMAAPVALDLLQIWYQIKSFKLGRPILNCEEFKTVLQQQKVIKVY